MITLEDIEKAKKALEDQRPNSVFSLSEALWFRSHDPLGQKWDQGDKYHVLYIKVED